MELRLVGFGVLVVLVLTFVLAVPVGDVVAPVPGGSTVTQPVVQTGQSIVYYLKVLNKNLLDNVRSTVSPTSTGQKIFVVSKPGTSGTFLLFYRYNNNRWEWSLDTLDWMTTDKLTPNVVSSIPGAAQGKFVDDVQPVANTAIIMKLRDAKDYETGRQILLAESAKEVGEKTTSNTTVSQSGVSTNTSLSNSVTWTGIRTRYLVNSMIIFPSVTTSVTKTKGVLSLQYLRVKGNPFESGIAGGLFDWDYGSRFINVYLDSVQKKCYDRIVSISNLSGHSMYLAPFEEETVCDSIESLVDNKPLVSIKASKTSSADSVIITSPLIPDSCNGKTLDNVYAKDGVLTVPADCTPKLS